ncbi:MAG TPA: tetratricopeptide repeat protein [Flavobacterium sp.]|jgi:tetratricopeptide (TPR) repeat protein|nr:tetratricopeptide repeat protein [Flavobacterium sp.]HPJ11308.1 tetratricopeptide repeat protein [Flavobacterium sp.]
MFSSNRPNSLVSYCLSLCFFVVLMAQAAPTDRCDQLIREGIDAMNRNENIKSLELLTQARVIAEKNRWYTQQFLAINNIGANYYGLLEYGEALNHYLEAYTIALRELDPKYEMTVLNNIAILYSKEKNYEKANEYFGKAYAIAKANKDPIKLGLYAMNLGNVASETGNYKLARRYFEESIPLMPSQPQFIVLAKIGLADCDLNTGKSQQARENASVLLKTTKDLDFNDTGISLLTIIAKSYLKQNNLAQAESFAQQTFTRQPDLETKITIFELLSEINAKQQDFDAALRFKDSVLKANIAIHKIKDGKLFENSKVKFEIQNYRNEIKLNEAKMASERKIFYSIIAIIIIVVLFVVWTLRNISIKHKQKKIIAERNERILKLELDKKQSDNLLLEQQFNEKQAIALLEQERLKNELESRNRKLSAKALYLSGRNEMIEQVLTELSQTPQLAKDATLVNHIHALKGHLKSDGEWDSFITHFEEVNQGFLNTLKHKHPNLTANDIRFLSYIYMNLSTKEIASMLNVTAEACRKRKERISAKMELPDNINLYDYLASL